MLIASLIDYRYNALMEYGFWIAFGAITTLILAVTAFLNIIIESRSRTRSMKLIRLDEIRNWTMEAYQQLLWLARFAKERPAEAKHRLAILMSRSTTILDSATVFGEDMEKVVNDGINLIIENTKSSPILTEEEGMNISHSLFDILEVVSKYRSELVPPAKANIFSRSLS